MPSPFPGMDPYLEERSRWPDVHLSLISYIREELQPDVRPKYLARIGEHVEIAELGKSYIPDVMLVQPPREAAAPTASAGVLLADEPATYTVLDEARHVPYIEITHRETGDVVTVIEVLSPANKIGNGREEYLRKQENLLSTPVNLVEIDLLSYGRPTALSRTVEIKKPHWRYTITISRGERRGMLQVYAFSLMERLPRCRIPLLPEDDDVVLDLPAVFTRCYDVGGYDLLIDYTQPPPVELNEEEVAWLQTYLQQLGVRHA